ncbi:MAG TPA: hypothetical protein VKA48_10450 [Gammaproteobacteria bacterium]|nr:hypothetical protein [Gammaproteobacteria bacterium]
MQDVGQSTPEAPQIPDLETARLRYKLLSEEAEEACDELDVLSMNIDMGANQEFILRDMRKAGKEMADVLVVAYGGLVALGLDPDEVFAYVMEENEAKTEHAVDRGDGKRVVPPDVKENLKAETKAKLERLVEGAG